jgi:hypothetical protein
VRRDLGVDQLEEEEEGLDGAGGLPRWRVDAGVLRLVARLHGGGAGRREAALIGNRRRARGRRVAVPRRVRRRRPELPRLPVSLPSADERWSSCCATRSSPRSELVSHRGMPETDSSCDILSWAVGLVRRTVAKLLSWGLFLRSDQLPRRPDGWT